MFLLKAFVVLIAVITVAESNIQKCKPLVQCPALLSMIQTKPNHKSTIQFLNSRHCGFEGRMPKVWCDNSNFTNFTCKTPNSKEGTCTPIKDCKYMIGLLKSLDLNNENTKAFIRGHKCNSTENDEIISVCCPKMNTEIRELLPNSEECGINKPLGISKKWTKDNCVIGGEPSLIGQYPWMALLYFVKINNGVFLGCAGSLISKNFVLTAAHCLDKYMMHIKGIGKLEHIVLGEYDVKSNPDCSNGTCVDPVINVVPENFYIHHQWNISTGKNDIALIKLKETVTFTDYITPICLPEPRSNVKLNDKVIVAGWGQAERGLPSFILLHARLPIVYRHNCSLLGGELSSKQLCIGVSSNGSASCQGDSGGPLMKSESRGDQSVFKLIGIVSYGSVCGKFPGVYTYVTPYLDWIHEIIENDMILNG